MNEDKAHIIRKTFIIITLILLFATAGLFLISTQLKTINLNYYGEVRSIKTLSTSVDSFLLQNKIYINDNTNVEPSIETNITNGMEISIYAEQELAKINIDTMKTSYTPVMAKLEEVIENIPFEEEKRDNSTMNRGTTNTVQVGVEGQKSTKYIVKYNNDEEIYRAELSTQILSESKNQVVEVGTKLNPVASRSAVVNSVGSAPVDGGFRQYNIKLPLEQQKYAYNISKRYGIQYELFLAVMYKESGFNPSAFGGGNSYGLCQIHVSNHGNLRRKLGINDFFNPYDNMTAGAYLLSAYFSSARNVVSDGASVEAYALNSYNMGEGTYFNLCYSKGVLNRAYSNSIIALRNRLISNGGI